MTKELPEPRWNTVAIYGVGLIGGSIGMALRQRNLARRVVGVGRSAKRLRSAVELGAIHSFVTDPAELSTPDIVILCAPVQLVGIHCLAIAKSHPSALITDAGSTKAQLVADIQERVPAARFVGSHPLAGSDKSGVQHALPDLYEDRLVILTPTEHTESEVTQEITNFWKSIGARTIELSPAVHDHALAATSHVPHVIARCSGVGHSGTVPSF